MARKRGIKTGVFVAGAVFLGSGALATYLTAQPQQPTTLRTIQQPIGQPRVELTLMARIPVLSPPGAAARQDEPAACAAPVDVLVDVPTLSLNLRTEKQAVWYSLVDTIPPVGHVASITVDPVNLLEGDRKVGTLLSGEVKFREIVKDIPLDGSDRENRLKIQALLREFGTITWPQLASLTPVTMEPYTLPGAGVQVMRAELAETYEIEGVGRDTVQLRGWIAVSHGDPRTAPGETVLSWNTAVTDTEFIGLDLRGESDLFGPIHVKLDTTRRAIGQVGRIQLPELARYALLAKYKKEVHGLDQQQH